MNRRRKVFDKHLLGLELGEADFEAVKKKLGEPARTLTEEKVTVFEYDDPAEGSIAHFKKMQCIFFDDLLLNVSYVEPDPKLTRAALHKVLGEPDATPEGEDDDPEEDEGLADIFEVEMEEEPMLSFAAHYDEEEHVEALSLCAEISEDLLDDDDDEADSDDDAADGDADVGD